MEREIDFALSDLPYLRLSLRNPDFTTAVRVATAINQLIGAQTAKAVDPTSVMINVPPQRRADLVAFLGEVEQLRVQPDQVARVVIDEASGVIVMGENVRISTVAIAQGKPDHQNHRNAAGVPARTLQPGGADHGGAAHRHSGG